ncbi:hypothetical protein SBA4_3050003 [Candidatus Sulfopaludibacter sp. SbA4]|nr:hypothetical protein SBA4_3050003 [Candidatus Sulfopaludibacter sp. SbA4]
MVAERGRDFVTHREGYFYKMRHKRGGWAGDGRASVDWSGADASKFLPISVQHTSIERTAMRRGGFLPSN